MRLYERVLSVEGERDAFRVVTDRGEHPCRRAVVATGFFDVPNRLGLPGEEPPRVVHYYQEPLPLHRPTGGCDRRQELGGQGGSGLLPARCRGHPDPPGGRGSRTESSTGCARTSRIALPRAACALSSARP